MYNLNEELTSILIKNGFVEIPISNFESEFKLSKRAQKCICIKNDGQRYLQVFPDVGSSSPSMTELSTDNLKSLMLYFKLSPLDYKEFNFKGKLDYDSYKKLEDIKKEFRDLERVNVKKLRQGKLKRIIFLAENILALN